MKKALILILFFWLFINFGRSQHTKANSFILLKTQDTIFTKKLNYNWKDKADFLTYKDSKNKIQYVADSLVSFFYSNKIKHIIAYNNAVNEKFICRGLLTGKIDVYEVINNGLKKEFYVESESYSGFINNQNFKSTLIPILHSCSNFYPYMFREEESFLFTQHYIKYYNRNCLENPEE